MCSVYRITPNKQLQLELIKKQSQNEGSFLKIPSDFTTGAGQDGATPDFVSYPNIHYPPTSNASILAIVLIHCWNTGTSFYLFSFSYFIILLSIFHKAIEWLFHYRNWITLYLTFKYLSRIQNLCTQPSILSPEFFLSYLTTVTLVSLFFIKHAKHIAALRVFALSVAQFGMFFTSFKSMLNSHLLQRHVKHHSPSPYPASLCSTAELHFIHWSHSVFSNTV